jgi:hypothetical protein
MAEEHPRIAPIIHPVPEPAQQIIPINDHPPEAFPQRLFQENRSMDRLSAFDQPTTTREALGMGGEEGAPEPRNDGLLESATDMAVNAPQRFHINELQPAPSTLVLQTYPS